MGLHMAEIGTDGRLTKQFLPAVYIDSSVLIDYVLAEPPRASPDLPTTFFDRLNQVIRRVVQPQGRLAKVRQIRKKLVDTQTRPTAIVSPLCLMEFAEWRAHSVFSDYAANSLGAKQAIRMGRKDVGCCISRILSMGEDCPEGEMRSAAKFLASDLLLTSTWTHGDEFNGLFWADIQHFSLGLSDMNHPDLLACAQVGAADILHLLFARHLGCQYLASFDADYKRARDLAGAWLPLEVLVSPEELLAKLQSL